MSRNAQALSLALGMGLLLAACGKSPPALDGQGAFVPPKAEVAAAPAIPGAGGSTPAAGIRAYPAGLAAPTERTAVPGDRMRARAEPEPLRSGAAGGLGGGQSGLGLTGSFPTDVIIGGVPIDPGSRSAHYRSP